MADSFHPPLKKGTFTITSRFAQRGAAFHFGLDFAAAEGTPIYASLPGVVVEGKERAQGSVQGFGSWVRIQCDDGPELVYGHVRHPSIRVRAGQRVQPGQIICEVGNEGVSTGPHLHFEVHPNGFSPGSQIDPERWLANFEQHTTTEGGDMKKRFFRTAQGGTVRHFNTGGNSCARITVHTAESTASAWQLGANWFMRPEAKVSYHYGIDSSEVVQYVHEKDQAWHAVNGNATSIGISFMCFANRTRAQWLADDKMFTNGVMLAADICRRHNIPVEKLNANNWYARKGLAGHVDVPGNANRSDPGRNFPWDVFLERIRQELGRPSAPADPLAWPLPSGYYFGPASGPEQSVSGTWSGEAPHWRTSLAAWQKAVGLPSTGTWDTATALFAKEIQKGNNWKQDGLIGPGTWAAGLGKARQAAEQEQKNNTKEPDMTNEGTEYAKDARAQLTGSTVLGQYPGFPQLGNRTVVDALAKIGAHLEIDGFSDPDASKDK